MPRLDEDSLQKSDEAFECLLKGGRRAEKAFETLYTIYARPFHGHLTWRRVSPSDAEEIVQEVFVAIWALRGKPKQLAIGSYAYLFSICRNKHIDWLRRRIAVTSTNVLPELAVEESDRTLATLEQDDCEEAGFLEFQKLEPERAEILRLATRQARKLSIEEVAHYIGRTPRAATEFLSQSRFRYRDFIRRRCSEFLPS